GDRTEGGAAGLGLRPRQRGGEPRKLGAGRQEPAGGAGAGSSGGEREAGPVPEVLAEPERRPRRRIARPEPPRGLDEEREQPDRREEEDEAEERMPEREGDQGDDERRQAEQQGPERRHDAEEPGLDLLVRHGEGVLLVAIHGLLIPEFGESIRVGP